MAKDKRELTTETRLPNGKWKKGVSGNPGGKPAQNLSRRLLADNSVAITETVIGLALAGDLQALTLCMNRIVSPLRPQQQEINLPATNPGDLAGQAEQVITAVLGGVIPPDTGERLVAALVAVTKIRESENTEIRLRKLEQEVAKWL